MVEERRESEDMKKRAREEGRERKKGIEEREEERMCEWGLTEKKHTDRNKYMAEGFEPSPQTSSIEDLQRNHLAALETCQTVL